jgi:ribonuclease HI
MITRNQIMQGKADMDISNGIFIFSDGAVRTDSTVEKGFRGGFGVALYFNGVEQMVYSGASSNTTVSRMEMTGVLAALKIVNKNKIMNASIVSDSQLVIRGITEWMDGWKRKNWTKFDKTPVENIDIWQQIDAELNASDAYINFIWVKGHNGNLGNERVDFLAGEAVDSLEKK